MLIKLKDLFSYRQDRTSEPKPLTRTLRGRSIQLIMQSLGPESRARTSFSANDDYRSQFVKDMHEQLSFVLGRPWLVDARIDKTDDLGAYLERCKDEEFLDFLELFFRWDSYWRACSDENWLVDQINNCFDLDSLPYALTRFTVETIPADPLGRWSGEGRRLRDLPRVVPRGESAVHTEAIGPVLELLADSRLAQANKEFVDALSHLRKRELGDCLTKCCSAFESTLKVICREKKGWTIDDRDTVAKLVEVVAAKAPLDSFFIEPLKLIGTLRHRLSTAHGAGEKPREPSYAKARFAVNATAAAILLCVEESRLP